MFVLSEGSSPVRCPLKAKSNGEMMREKVGIILGSPTNYDILPFRYFILALNQVQTIYEFSFPDQEISFVDDEYTEERLLDFVASTHRVVSPTVDYLIAITTRRIRGNLFFTSRANVAAITTDVWEKYFSPPSLFEYLLHCIAATVIFMNPSLDLDSHVDTRGCVLDYTRWKHDDRIDIALGYICDNHSEEIQQALGDSYLKQMQLVIDRKWIGSISDNGTVAYNLKHFFRFDIGRDSGFNKSFWERAKAKLDELPGEGIKKIIEAIIAVLLAALLLKLGLKKD